MNIYRIARRIIPIFLQRNMSSLALDYFYNYVQNREGDHDFLCATNGDVNTAAWPGLTLEYMSWVSNRQQIYIESDYQKYCSPFREYIADEEQFAA